MFTPIAHAARPASRIAHNLPLAGQLALPRRKRTTGAARPIDSGHSAPGANDGRSCPGPEPLSEADPNVTRLLQAAASGHRGDLDALMAAIYADLRRLAVVHLRGERADHTLQPTALVHEAYIRLVDQRTTDWRDRAHFFAVASRIIRRILVDHARERLALKRGGAGERLRIDESQLSEPARGLDLIGLDEALTDLAALDERQARIVELRFFGGCSIEEVAELLGIGARSVDRQWRAAKAWLYCRLNRERAGAGDD